MEFRFKWSYVHTTFEQLTFSIYRNTNIGDWQLSVINKGLLGKLRGRTAGVKMDEPSAIILTLASNLVVGSGKPLM